MLEKYCSPAHWLAWLMVMSLMLVACGGQPITEQPTVSPTATQETVVEPTATTVNPTAETTSTEIAQTGPAKCEAVDIPDNPNISPVSATDWTKGPANAPFSLIEYGDFQ